MSEIFFLIILASIWLIFAVVQDLKKREIANWLNFSLIIFAMGFRFFYSLFSGDFNFFYQGLIWIGIFFVLANVLYYTRFFAGGDFKLMIALGAVIPFSSVFLENLKIFSFFLAFFFLIGGLYLVPKIIVVTSAHFEKFKKEFKKQFKIYYKICMMVLFLLIVLSFLSLLVSADILILIPLIILAILPYLYVYLKAVERVGLIKLVDAKSLTEGDLLYKDIKIGKKIIKADWNGLSSEEIKQLRKRKVWVRDGIPFSPVFLISFLAVIYFWFSGMIGLLWNSFW